MAALAPQKINLNNINGGNRFNAGDGVTFDAINAPIEAAAYVQGLTQTPNTANVDQVGTPTVSIEEVNGLPRLKFSHLKGEPGSQGPTGPTGPQGPTGARIISMTLKGQDEHGGNIYVMTFDNGTTASFTAPAGDGGTQKGSGLASVQTEDVSNNIKGKGSAGLGRYLWDDGEYNFLAGYANYSKGSCNFNAGNSGAIAGSTIVEERGIIGNCNFMFSYRGYIVGDYNALLGYESEVYSEHCCIIGARNGIGIDYDITGEDAKNHNNYYCDDCFIIGKDSIIYNYAPNCIVVGHHNTVLKGVSSSNTNVDCMLFGNYLTAGYREQTILGRNNIEITDPNYLLIVGNGTSYFDADGKLTQLKSNAVEMLTDGSTTFRKKYSSLPARYVVRYVIDYSNADESIKPFTAFQVLNDGRAQAYKAPEEDEDVVRLRELKARVPNLPTDAGNRTYVLKAVNGVIKWVGE